MSERLIELEADTVEEAERKLKNINELIVLEWFVVCRELVEIVEAVAETVEAAFMKAQSKVPAGAKIETRDVKTDAKQITLRVQADSEESAGAGKAEMITSVSLLKKGRKGLFGFGKTVNVYQVVVSQKAWVELKFRVRAKLRARVRNYTAEELLKSVGEARSKNAQWAEILRLLNPKNDAEIERSLHKLGELNPLSMLDTIEEACRENETAEWRTLIIKTEARASKARNLEMEESKVRLRKLDVEIAETFMFYTSVDWYEKDYRRKRKEPTGLPRDGYGTENFVNPTLRETIPHYSSNNEAFGKLERRIKAFNLYEIYLRFLFEEVLDEAAASLEQKCVAALKDYKSRETNIYKTQTAQAGESRESERLSDSPQKFSESDEEKASDELWKKLIVRLLGDREKAFRIVYSLKRKNPNRSERWCVEKVIEDLERDCW